MLADAKTMPSKDDAEACIQSAINYLREALAGILEVVVRIRNHYTRDIFLGDPEKDDWHGHAIVVSYNEDPYLEVCGVRHYGKSRRRQRKAVRRTYSNSYL